MGKKRLCNTTAGLGEEIFTHSANKSGENKQTTNSGNLNFTFKMVLGIINSFAVWLTIFLLLC
ncbi:MAG: hypothetical protein PHN47_00015 [Clostridia bacterium]|nr:hypothetical protein [Clostridia bacterium]MDD4570865.1 hypothetical protein [Clostridia bacterium]